MYGFIGSEFFATFESFYHAFTLSVNVHITKEKREVTTKMNLHLIKFMHSGLQVRKRVIVAKRIVDDLFSNVHGLDVNERK